MSKQILLFVLLCTSQHVLASTYGEPIKSQKKCQLKDVTTNFNQYKNKTITTFVKVDKVCQKKGCWMEVSDDGVSMRVTFKDYGFFVPQDLMGKRVNLEGKVVEKTVSVEEARHFLADEGASKTEIAKITTPQVKYHFVVTGVVSVK